MDFIEGIGERYLMGKANQVPQKLENLAKKQFSSATDTRKQAAQASTLPSEEKDQEIAKLRKQLAETKLEKGKAKGKANSKAGISSARSVASVNSRASVVDTKYGEGSAKEMKGLTPLSIGADKSKANKGEKGSSSSVVSRGRRASTSTATAAKAHKAHSEVKSGGHSISVPRKNINNESSVHGLEALGATQALARGDAASKAAGSAASAHRSGRSRSVAQKSEIEGKDRSTNAVIVSQVPPPPPPADHAPRKSELAYAEVTYEVEEPDMYVVEVEEDRPRRRKKSIKGKSEKEGVTELSSGNGRTMYRIT